MLCVCRYELVRCGEKTKEVRVEAAICVQSDSPNEERFQHLCCRARTSIHAGECPGSTVVISTVIKIGSPPKRKILSLRRVHTFAKSWLENLKSAV